MMHARRPHAIAPMPSLFFAVAVLTVAGAAAAQTAQEALPGYDLFVTNPDETDLLGIDFVGEPLSPPFFDFDPGPLVNNRATGATDTIVRRIDAATVPATPGTAPPIDIEVVRLNLNSQLQFDPDGAGPLPADFLYVTLQKDRGLHPLDPPVPAAFPNGRSFGTMDVTFDSADGGTFGADILVFADLRLGAFDGPRVCDAPLPPCADLDAGLLLSSVAQPWGRVPPTFSIRIQGFNRHLAGPGDTTGDFWAGVPAGGGTTVCVSHNGHPDPGGLPTAHGTCATPCTTSVLGELSGCDGQDNDCNGVIDDCAEDAWLPEPGCPPTWVLECAPVLDYSAAVTGIPESLDDCNPEPPAVITGGASVDFITPRCGRTFDVDRIWTVPDGCGNEAVCLQQIFVVDTTPPVFSVAGTQFDFSIWPPGHGYVVYSTDDLVSASDTCGGTTVAVTGCHSSQPENVVQGPTPDGGNGDGNTAEDCVVSLDGRQFAVRRERLGACGPFSSRTYTIEFTASDDCGNQSRASGLVRIEHDRSDHVPLELGVMLPPSAPPPFPYAHPTTYGLGCAD